MKKKKIKIHFLNLFILIFVIIFLGYIIFALFNHFNMEDDNTKLDTKTENKLVDKLEDLGYSKEAAEKIVINLDESIISKINKKYDKLEELSNVKYFHYENIDKYEKLIKENKYDIEEVVMRVNTHIDRDFYTDITTIDNYNDLDILVNKYYSLPDDFVPTDLIEVGNGQKMKSEAGEALMKMIKDIKSAGLYLQPQSGYRSLATQKSFYDRRVKNEGVEAADAVQARPGHSEHHTGLAIDVSHDGSLEKTFENTEQFKWLQDNAYKYGFILRYPKDKIYMTGYDYEPWHYRYVGIEVASLIHNENITYEEYCVKYKGFY